MTLTHAENPAQGHSPARNWRRNIERAGPLLLILLLVVLWQILTRALDIPSFLLPAPTDIARLMVDEWPLIQMHSLATIGSIVSGYITVVVFALAISALMIRFRLVERLIMPIFVGLQSVPKIAIAPLIQRRRRHRLEDSRGHVDRVLPDLQQHDGWVQRRRSRACRRLPLGRRQPAADLGERSRRSRRRSPVRRHSVGVSR